VKSPKNAVILILALATLGGAVVMWNQHQELIELRAAALNEDERATLRKQLWDAKKRAEDLAAELAALRNRGPAESGEGSDALVESSAGPGENRRARRGPGGGRGNGGGGGAVGNVMSLLEQPEMQRLMAIQQKAQLDGRYAALFKNLNLSPEQLDKFKSLLVEKQSAMQDVMAAARSQGINPREDPEGFRKMIADTQAEVDNQIKATLGEDGFAKYQNYQETFPQRGVVSQLQQSLSYTGAPLTDSQAEQLVQILAQTSRGNPGGGRNQLGPDTVVSVGMSVPMGDRGGGPVFNFGGFGPGGGSSTPITDEAISLAQSVLSGPQVQSLVQLQQQQQAQQQLQQAFRQNLEIRGNGSNRGGGDGSSGGNAVTQPGGKGG
jgi:hypothetical protein